MSNADWAEVYRMDRYAPCPMGGRSYLKGRRLVSQALIESKKHLKKLDKPTAELIQAVVALHK